LIVGIGKRWFAKESRREELLPERETSGVCFIEVVHERGASLFPPDLHREISPPHGLWWSLRRPERTGAKRVADRGNIGSPHWITSGEAIFRKSESNVTWRGESEGIDVETVMSNRYFYKYPPWNLRKTFQNPGVVRSAFTQLH